MQTTVLNASIGGEGGGQCLFLNLNLNFMARMHVISVYNKDRPYVFFQVPDHILLSLRLGPGSISNSGVEGEDTGVQGGLSKAETRGQRQC